MNPQILKKIYRLWIWKTPTDWNCLQTVIKLLKLFCDRSFRCIILQNIAQRLKDKRNCLDKVWFLFMDIFESTFCIARYILFDTIAEHGDNGTELHQMIIRYRRHSFLMLHAIIGKFCAGTKGDHILLGQHDPFFLSCWPCCKKHAGRKIRIQLIFLGYFRQSCLSDLIHRSRFCFCHLFCPQLLIIIYLTIQKDIRL